MIKKIYILFVDDSSLDGEHHYHAHLACEDRYVLEQEEKRLKDRNQYLLFWKEELENYLQIWETENLCPEWSGINVPSNVNDWYDKKDDAAYEYLEKN